MIIIDEGHIPDAPPARAAPCSIPRLKKYPVSGGVAAGPPVGKSPRRDFYEETLKKRLYEDQGPDQFELPASAVSAKLVHALENMKPKPRYYVTTPTYVMGFLKRILPTRAMDWVLSRI